MRSAGITFISLALTTAVIGNAYYQKKQFYPSVVYITKSNPSMAVIYVQALIIVVMMGKLMRKIFFGQLRAAEFEHLMERSWYAVTETCLAFTVFRDDFSPKFVALFTVLLFIKSFHWLAEERVDFMERSPVISWLFHIRVLSLLTLLGALDLNFVGLAYQSTVTKGASVQLVFGFEYAILLTIIVNIFIKYVLHTLDLNSENPWDNKAVFLLYTELVMGFFKVILYIAFVAIMVRIYTLPLFAFRPMYYTMRSFKKAFNDVILSRRAIRNMNTLYPDATPEELAAADNVCIICREEMSTASKRLPCNHIFHTACLRSWFQRQQTCPTCRLNILRQPAGAAAGGGGGGPAQQPPRQQARQQADQPQAGPNMFQARINQFQPGFVPFWQPFQQAGGAEAAGQPGGAGGPTPTATSAGPPHPQAYPNFPLFSPPFPFMPFAVPPPVPPPDLGTLSDEELRRMEGTAREAVEARLRCLQNVQLLLDASVTLMQHYASVAPPPQLFRVPAPPPPAAPQAAPLTVPLNVTPQVVTPPPPPYVAPPPQPSTSQVSPGSAEADCSEPTPATTVTQSDSSLQMNAKSESSLHLAEPSTSSAESLAASGGSSEKLAAPPVLTKEQEEIRRRRLEKFAALSTNAE